METLQGQGFVELIDHLGSDQSIVRAARVSYAGDGKAKQSERDKKLLDYLLRNRHSSPLEHVIFTFHVKAPLFTTRQWMRHRNWSYNEISARYTKVDNDFYIPEAWRGQSKDNKQMSDGLVSGWDQPLCDDLYKKSVEQAYFVYHSLLDMGVSREMARMVLPVSSFTRFYATVDLHNLLHFLELRNHEHAQHEIREYAQAIEEIIRPIVPWTLEAWSNIR